MYVSGIFIPLYLSGRYGEEFVAKRQEKLQRWSNRIARHPVLSQCEVVSHFILCDDSGVRIEFPLHATVCDLHVACMYIF